MKDLEKLQKKVSELQYQVAEAARSVFVCAGCQHLGQRKDAVRVEYQDYSTSVELRRHGYGTHEKFYSPACVPEYRIVRFWSENVREPEYYVKETLGGITKLRRVPSDD